MTSRSVAAFLLLMLLTTPDLLAQGPPRAMPAGPGEIRGKLVDSVSGRAVAAGSITVRRASDSSFASGALIRDDGTFKVEGLAPGTYVVRIRSLGFAQLSRPNVVITADKPTADLGTIALMTVAAKLETKNVTAEREETVVQPDRTVYSTKNMPAA